MPTDTRKDLVPVAEMALRSRLTREQVIRRITKGELAGEQRNGRWYVVVDAAPKSAA